MRKTLNWIRERRDGRSVTEKKEDRGFQRDGEEWEEEEGDENVDEEGLS